jgi:tripartite-type tricarboxylate transporter receptor subunit TctC
LKVNFARGISAVLLLLAAGFSGASAEPYPSQRLTLIVPFPPGSATDSVTRHLAESIRAATNATVVVENKPGADGNLAALAVLKAEPDGYTAFVTTNSTQAANVNLFNSLPYDPKADFAPVAGIMTIPMMLTVKSDFPAKSVAEFVELAKKRPKPLSFGSGNTSSRGAAELFRFREGIEMQHVPYRGMPQALTDVMGRQIDCVFADPASAQGLVLDGKLRALAVTSSTRLETMPNLPTIAESGLPGYELTAWVGKDTARNHYQTQQSGHRLRQQRRGQELSDDDRRDAISLDTGRTGSLSGNRYQALGRNRRDCEDRKEMTPAAIMAAAIQDDAS